MDWIFPQPSRSIIVKLASAYVALALGLLTFTALSVQSLCTRTRANHAQEMENSETYSLRRRYWEKWHQTLCRTIVQVQLLNINVYPLNALTFAPTAASRISLFGLPLARTILPHSLALPLPNPIQFLPGLFDYPSP